MRARRGVLLRALVALVALALGGYLAPARAAHGGGSAGAASAAATTRPAYVPPVRHVFVINIENKGYNETWGPASTAPYLAKHLRSQGVLLNSYYGTAHNSLPNYIAQISGQAPNSQTQADCQNYTKFTRTGPDQAPGQAVGAGCVLPKSVESLPRQLSAAGLRWKGYLQQMPRRCAHPKLGTPDSTQHASPGHNYAARHDPFVYLRSITANRDYCRQHVRPLGLLRSNLRHVRSTPNFSYITPDLCRDGHDDPCANGKPGGLVQVNEFLKKWAPRILGSPAFKHNGMLIITADESDGPTSDSASCCGETAGPNVLLGTGPGISGPGGGRIGALVISQWTKHHSWSTTPYNHYSLLGSLEEIFGLPKLGMASVSGLDVFGLDVYNTHWFVG